MVDTQVRPSDVTKFPIIDAMLSVPREAFVPDELAQAAYVGDTLDIGGRVLLEPRVFGKMLDSLDLSSSDTVLDLGCGLGYSAAVLAHMTELVVGVEEDADRAAEAQERLSENGVHNAAILSGPLQEGAAKHGPYDAIIIEGGIQQVPAALLDQLKEGGRIAAIFQVGQLGTVKIGRMRGGAVTWRDAFNASAPLIEGFERTVEFEL